VHGHGGLGFTEAAIEDQGEPMLCDNFVYIARL
jgi:hypothetical protein